ncbi:hypothetical protein BLOT_008599 [Blomia tropicalis]|nr:hypothetical protein BLOT_008599 [Blomia tropicalis]
MSFRTRCYQRTVNYPIECNKHVWDMIVLTIHDSFLLLAITLISNNWAIEQLYLGNERMDIEWNTPTYNIDREGVKMTK